jgi:hypothetical protein
MPPKKKAKVVSFEKVLADVESSNWTADEYDQLIELCESKRPEEKKDDDFISPLIQKYLKVSQDKITDLEEEKADLVKRHEEGDESVTQDDLDSQDACISGAINSVSLFSKLKSIEVDHQKNILRYDRHEGEMSSEIIVRVGLECEGKPVTFIFERMSSSYGGDNSTSFLMESPSIRRLTGVKQLLEHWGHYNDYTMEDEFPDFICEVFDDLIRRFYNSGDGLFDRETLWS